MAIRDDFTINWAASPRVIEIAKPSTECNMQDLLDTLRWLESQPSAMDNSPIISASGKEPLGGGTKVGLTVAMLNAKVSFEARDGTEYGGVDEWTICNLLGGNLVAFDTDGVTTIEPLHSTAFVNIAKTSSSSATLQEQDALNYSSYGNVVSIDVTSERSGTEYPSGNMEYPVNNVPDAVAIAKDKGFTVLSVRGDLTLDAGDDVRDFELIGVSHVNSTLIVKDAALCLRTRFTSFNITGKLDGDSEINKCVINDLDYFNGHIHDSLLNGTIVLNGDANAVIDDCAILNILNTPTIDCNHSDQNLIMTNWSGTLNIINSGANNNVGLGCDAADIHIDSSCVDGIIAISGTGSVIDNSGPVCYVINKIIDGSEMQNLKVLIEQLRPHHTGGGKMIFWDPYEGSDLHHGDSADRGFKTWAKCHDTASNAGHDVIVIVPANPSGVTTITENISVTKDYLFIRGPGRDVLTTGSITTTARGTEFSGFRVNNTEQDATGIISSGAFTLLNNIWFEDCSNGVSMSAHHPLVHSCKFHGMNGYAVRMAGDISHGEIYDCTMGDAGGNAVEIDTTAETGGIKMRDTVIVGAAGYGVTLSSTTRKFVSESGNVVINNTQGNFNDLGTDNVLNVEGSVGEVAIDPQAIWEYETRTLTASVTSSLTVEQDEALMLTKYQNKAVYVDTDASTNGDGSNTSPFDNIGDAIDFAELSKINILYVFNDITIDRNLKNFTVLGIGSPKVLCNGQDLKNTEFHGCNLLGTYTSPIKAFKCILESGLYLNGGFKECSLIGDLTCLDGGTVIMSGCFSGIAGVSRPTISMNGTGESKLSVRSYSGGLTLKDVNNVNDECTLEVSQGKITVDSSCTAGYISVRGTAQFTDESTGATIDTSALLNSEILASNTDISRLLDYNEGSWKIIANQMIYYKRDGSEFMRFDLLDSAGQPISRGAMQRVKV